MVNLGPQFVQLMNGYPNRRSSGSASSARQSAQVALSAETSARRRPDRSLATIENPVAPPGGKELAHPVSGPLPLREDAVDVVAHPAGQAEPGGHGVRERAEPDSLDHALHADRRPDALGHPPSLSRAWRMATRAPQRGGSSWAGIGQACAAVATIQASTMASSRQAS